MPRDHGAGVRVRVLVARRRARARSPTTVAGIARPLVAAATTYFVFNTCLIAVAVSLATRQSFVAVWNQNFLWSAPSYFVGAGAAAIATWAVMTLGLCGSPSLTAAPLYLTYRTYKVYLGRIDDERRHVEEMADLHLATIEALALAIDAKDQTAQSHIRRVQVYATSIARGLGHVRHRNPGRQDRGAAPRHRQAGRARAHPVEARAADAGRVPEDPRASAGRRGDHQRGAVPVSGRAADSQPPRALGRQGLSAGTEGRRDSARRAHPLGRRLLRRADVRSSVSQGDDARSRARRCCSRKRAARSIRRSCRCSSRWRRRWKRPRTPSKRRRRGASRSNRPTSAAARPSASSPKPSKSSTVFEDIALAHREIYALYEIAQTMGTSLGVADTMALISSKLANLVPFSACALFLFDEEADTLRCRFATGVEADAIGTMTVRAGQGLAGWVARNRRPLVNARPSAEFEAAGLAEVDHAAVGAGGAARLQRSLHRHAGRLLARRRISTPTIIAACSIASANRPPRSSTTRSCSSRRRRIRSPIR